MDKASQCAALVRRRDGQPDVSRSRTEEQVGKLTGTKEQPVITHPAPARILDDARDPVGLPVAEPRPPSTPRAR